MDKRPIGVFDSGVGGLTCAKQIAKLLPNERIIYFADTARMPYGSLPKETLEEYTGEISAFLLEQGAKALVTACNTTSTTCMDYLRERFSEVPYLDMVLPCVNAMVKDADGFESVGLIATPATVASGAHAKHFAELLPQKRFAAKACPNLARAIEDGKAGTPEMKALLREYLDGFVAENEPDALILGCTHYPLVSADIRELYPNLKLIDPAIAVAEELARLLAEKDMLAPEKAAEAIFYTSEPTETLKTLASGLVEGEPDVRKHSFGE